MMNMIFFLLICTLILILLRLQSTHTEIYCKEFTKKIKIIYCKEKIKFTNISRRGHSVSNSWKFDSNLKLDPNWKK